MNTSTVSVIIPCYNDALTLERAAHSALRADAVKEVIIVCDGSTDGSIGVARALQSECPERVVSIVSANGGPSRARNLGMDRATGEYLLFLDADDYLTPGGIGALVKSAGAKDADIAVGLAIDDYGSFQQPQNPERLRGESDCERLVQHWWAISTVLIRRGALRWREGMNAWEVIDFFLRHLLVGYSVTYCEEYVTVIRHASESPRVTQVYGHYEPVRTALFFNEVKWRVKSFGKLNERVASVLDFQILGALVIAHRTRADLSKVWQRLDCDPARFPHYSWYRPTGASGFCRTLGLRRGLKVFDVLTRLFQKVLQRRARA